MAVPLDGFRAVPLWSDGRATVVVSGEIDYVTAPCLREALDDCLARRPWRIDVDFGAVTFCDISGLNALLGARRKARAAGVRLHVINVRESLVAMLFRRVQAEDLIAPGALRVDRLAD
ncbi:STAS domain-containing protein [Streptomyces gilvosporeus]|uniref:STAS domain-containing protein n=1 Tax=Streptomyces gilvosporeus TaxID=553510 RepID=A0A1V0TMZ5_9ACTN|nr:STAS domain-containing protein [Streptomyces gilvosporeus]ARF54319.1 hypothetical protein B1H19_09010 [Streptomyces gilvosporeus]